MLLLPVFVTLLIAFLILTFLGNVALDSPHLVRVGDFAGLGAATVLLVEWVRTLIARMRQRT